MFRHRQARGGSGLATLVVLWPHSTDLASSMQALPHSPAGLIGRKSSTPMTARSSGCWALEATLLQELLRIVTGHRVTRPQFTEHRLILCTIRLGERAARMETAATRRADRVGDFTLGHGLGTSGVRVGHRHGREQCGGYRDAAGGHTPRATAPTRLASPGREYRCGRKCTWP